MTQQSTKAPFGDDPNYPTHCVCLDMSHTAERYRWVRDNPEASFEDYIQHFGQVFWENRVDGTFHDLRDPDVVVSHVEKEMQRIRSGE